MIEFTELKKHVITMLQEHDFNQPPVNDESIIQPQFGQYPRINFNVAKKERDDIQWFEQAFEWGNMTYVFYPYYWKRTYDWKFDVFSNDPDPLFSKFLQAGAARVVVPV